MPELRPYPVGIQSFSYIRENGCLYVDKTSYIHEMAKPGTKFYFLSRPRRFGKTLLVSTMEAYFQGRRELFRGLAIDSLEPGEWERYPVLRLDLSSFKVTDRGALDAKFEELFSSLEREWGIDGAGKMPGSRLAALVAAAFEQTGKPVVVLIDEYDSPLLTVMHEPALLEEFREVMRELYSVLKGAEDQIRFLFITGVSRFSQLSIFSELNNLDLISMDAQYAGICGITEQELTQCLVPDIEALARAMGATPAEALASLKAMYDGYHFAAASPDIYNPFSLMSALQKKALGSYWFGSGTPTALVNLLKGSDFDLQSLEGVEAPSVAFEAPVQNMDTPVPFMYQSGYLTIKGYDPVFRRYTLGLPNEEVREGLYHALLPAYSGMDEVESSALVVDLVRAAEAGEVDAMLGLLRSLFAEMHERIRINDEREFQQALYLVIRLAGAFIRAEVSMASGRADFVLETADAVYAFELKFSYRNRPATAEQAIEQIESRGYLVPYEAAGKRLVEVGVVFSEEARTIEEGWIVKEREGA